ncbi:hypothetical protein [Chromobacterium phragmitis]|uniref:hypothetical protein n=1 Tax=Chromobacterium phragmitis TaxID=2202141 RepID=UPI00143D6C29|nr:hypothetical protein [Chromobacterium phragmitis]
MMKQKNGFTAGMQQNHHHDSALKSIYYFFFVTVDDAGFAMSLELLGMTQFFL